MPYQIAPFHFDVTVPIGHSLCGGWIPPASRIDSPLEGLGFVLLTEPQPVVVCTLDWTGLCNDAHLQLCQALAKAAGTTADRVAVQCVHQHDAPFACLETDRIVRAQGDLPPNMDPQFFQTCLQRAETAVKESLKSPRRLTHVASAQAEVEQVASNRRVLNDQGKILKNRSVAASSDDIRDLPAGVIDPWLKTVAFYDGKEKVAACYYYAVHPISYCCTEGHVNSEFVGQARKLKAEHDAPDCLQVYFTGCAGNINAGKYNNSDHHENRPVLAQRIFAAMERASEQLRPEPIKRLQWTTADFLPPVNRAFSIAELEKQINDHSRRVVQRNRPAFTLAWLRRHAAQKPITLSGLHVNQISMLHLPAEPFIEYQLRTQMLYPERFMAVAGYGDGGPWYLPTAEAYFQGGYEVSVAFSGPEVDQHLMRGIKDLMPG